MTARERAAEFLHHEFDVTDETSSVVARLEAAIIAAVAEATVPLQAQIVVLHARLVRDVEMEREACAKLCEGKSDGEYIDIAGNIAELIRARSNP